MFAGVPAAFEKKSSGIFCSTQKGFCLPYFGVFLTQEEQKTEGSACGCNGDTGRDVTSAQNVNKCMERTFSSIIRAKMTQLGATMQEEGDGASWSTRTSGGIKHPGKHCPVSSCLS